MNNYEAADTIFKDHLPQENSSFEEEKDEDGMMEIEENKEQGEHWEKKDEKRGRKPKEEQRSKSFTEKGKQPSQKSSNNSSKSKLFKISKTFRSIKIKH